MRQLVISLSGSGCKPLSLKFWVLTSSFYFLILFTPLPSPAQLPYVTTAYGTGLPGLINGSPDSARFDHPFGICKGAMGNLFIADADNHCIRMVNDLGMVETFAGTGTAGYLDGPANQAQFNAPSDLYVDPDSNIVYVCDFQNQRIRRIANGMVTTLAGSGIAGYLDGPATTARFNYPRGICRDQQGNLYIGDSWNHRIRKIAPGGNVSTYAGGGSATGVGSVGAYVDGPDTAARFYTPAGLTIDLSGNLYVADAYNHRIRKIDTQQQVTTFGGSGPTGQGQGGFANGPALSARFNTPTEVFFIETYCPGNAPAIFIADTYNNRIRMMREDLGPWDVITYAGTGMAGFQNGPADSATFNYPRAITGWFGNASCFLYVVDYNNHGIRGLHDFYTSSPNVSAPSSALTVYPNPASDIISIVFRENENSESMLTIRDMTGRNVKEVIYQDQPSMSLDISSLVNGLYIITLSTGNLTREHLKLIKQ